MIRTLPLAVTLLVITASIAPAQTEAPAMPDTALANRDSVTAYAIRSGRLMLSSKANPKPVALPDGAYTNEAGVIIVFVNGRITRVQETTDKITEIGSARLNKNRLVTVTPSTNALMAVSEFILPSGTFTSEDRRSSVTIVFGRPTAFSLAGGT
jgi:hypothetical protein